MVSSRFVNSMLGSRHLDYAYKKGKGSVWFTHLVQTCFICTISVQVNVLNLLAKQPSLTVSQPYWAYFVGQKVKLSCSFWGDPIHNRHCYGFSHKLLPCSSLGWMFNKPPSKAVSLSKSSSLAAPLGVTKVLKIIELNLVTLCWTAQVWLNDQQIGIQGGYVQCQSPT